MGYLEYITQRETFSSEKQRTLGRLAKSLQGALYSSLVEAVLDRLDTDETGRIKFNTRNAGIAASTTAVWLAYRNNSGKVGQWIGKQLVKLFGLNTLYMNEVVNVNKTTEQKARNLLFKSLGFDIEKKQILQNSWLDNLLAQDEVKQRVMASINAAIRSRMPLKEFRKQFRNDFQDNEKGLGIVSKYYDTKTFDLFQQFDRSTQEVYREELGLEYAIYSGTLMQPVKGKTKGTRGFCWQRVNNIYSIDEIESWNGLDWAGKIDGADVKIVAGGYNCRHHLSYISEQIKNKLQERGRKVDEYTELPPGKTLKG